MNKEQHIIMFTLTAGCSLIIDLLNKFTSYFIDNDLVICYSHTYYVQVLSQVLWLLKDIFKSGHVHEYIIQSIIGEDANKQRKNYRPNLHLLRSTQINKFIG